MAANHGNNTRYQVKHVETDQNANKTRSLDSIHVKLKRAKSVLGTIAVKRITLVAIHKGSIILGEYFIWKFYFENIKSVLWTNSHP